jgi:hypothetical protein
LLVRIFSLNSSTRQQLDLQPTADPTEPNQLSKASAPQLVGTAALRALQQVQQTEGQKPAASTSAASLSAEQLQKDLPAENRVITATGQQIVNVNLPLGRRLVRKKPANSSKFQAPRFTAHFPQVQSPQITTPQHEHPKFAEINSVLNFSTLPSGSRLKTVTKPRINSTGPKTIFSLLLHDTRIAQPDIDIELDDVILKTVPASTANRENNFDSSIHLEQQNISRSGNPRDIQQNVTEYIESGTPTNIEQQDNGEQQHNSEEQDHIESRTPADPNSHRNPTYTPQIESERQGTNPGSNLDITRPPVESEQQASHNQPPSQPGERQASHNQPASQPGEQQGSHNQPASQPGEQQESGEQQGPSEQQEPIPSQPVSNPNNMDDQHNQEHLSDDDYEEDENEIYNREFMRMQLQNDNMQKQIELLQLQLQLQQGQQAQQQLCQQGQQQVPQAQQQVHQQAQQQTVNMQQQVQQPQHQGMTADQVQLIVQSVMQTMAGNVPPNGLAAAAPTPYAPNPNPPPQQFHIITKLTETAKTSTLKKVESFKKLYEKKRATEKAIARLEPLVQNQGILQYTVPNRIPIFKSSNDTVNKELQKAINEETANYCRKLTSMFLDGHRLALSENQKECETSAASIIKEATAQLETLASNAIANQEPDMATAAKLAISEVTRFCKSEILGASTLVDCKIAKDNSDPAKQKPALVCAWKDAATADEDMQDQHSNPQMANLLKTIEALQKDVIASKKHSNKLQKDLDTLKTRSPVINLVDSPTAQNPGRVGSALRDRSAPRDRSATPKRLTWEDQQTQSHQQQNQNTDTTGRGNPKSNPKNWLDRGRGERGGGRRGGRGRGNARGQRF